MKRFASLILASLLLTGAAHAATLKPDNAVNEDQLRLGDLFTGLPADQADRIVGQAPAPGRSQTLDAVALARIAAAFGVDWRPTGGGDRVKIERASVTIGAELIQEALVQALRDTGAPDGIDVALDNRSLSLSLPAGNDGSVRVENLAYDAVRNRVSADLVAPASGPELIRQTVGARAAVMVEVPVLARRLMPGDVITDSDLQWTKQARDRVGSDVAQTADALVGKTARRGVAPNQPVHLRDIREPIIVQKGQLVSILLQTSTMTLTAQGRALTDGSSGEVVRVINTASNRTIDAVVAGPNLVAVQAAGVSAPATPMKSAAVATALR